MSYSYGIGNGIRVSVKFKAVLNGALVDPTTVRVLVKDPSNNTQTLVYGVDSQLQKTGTGQYFYIVDGDEAGTWKYRWEGIGSNQAASEGSFIVLASTF